MAQTLEANVRDFGIRYFAPGSGDNGVCHVVFLAKGIIWPGMYVVFGDSHTSTYGALGAIAHGVGSTQDGHVLNTQSIAIDKKLKVRRINFIGEMQKGVTTKDVIIHTIRKMGAKAGNGFAHEYAGAAEEWGIEEAASACNMGVEGGAKVAYINPRQKAYDYLRGRPYAPKNIDELVEFWDSLRSDPDAVYDNVVEINMSEVEPMVTWGISPEFAVSISENLPPHEVSPESYDYMGLTPGQPIEGTPIDNVDEMSCTNARLSDISQFVEVLKNALEIEPERKVKAETKVVAGSERVKKDCEERGYDKIIKAVGAEWSEAPGCSRCLSMSPDKLTDGERTVATTNRPFKNRQGPGVRTHLVSPYTAAASALEGKITDPRKFL